ncbi:hypothetical protein WR25_24752 [Diploscapter pachys]|uniref:Winged helix Storkhead-box1 domain-containing protein n=1 Tax=Diploscapter pachys TaxID=2018661 RepID=A0A2A2KQ53_9BILA|nr:hypothetical protein WR25_24752 [Diploscapter pachys]
MSCIAIVLEGPKARNGRRVFESFVEQNRQCFWNRDLVAASNSLIYMGFMRPGTLFVSAPSSHLNVIRAAWARRILKAPEGYAISSLGDMGAIQTVEQVHFVPLGDVLCDAITMLNRQGHAATLQAVRTYVTKNCPHVAPPSLEMIQQTVKSLLASGVVYRMGDHLFVSVPTTSPPKVKVTVECQTGTSMMVRDEKKEKNTAGRVSALWAKLFAKKNASNLPPTLPDPLKMPMHPETNSHSLPPQHQLPMIPNKFPTFHGGFHEEYPRKRRHQRHNRKQLSSSSECLNYGPIDPPDCLPAEIKLIDDMSMKHRSRRRQRSVPKRREDPLPVLTAAVLTAANARTSTPRGGSDSAYSHSPVTDSNEDHGSWSEHEGENVDHTYINLRQDESTQFEDFPTLLEPLAKGVHISNL